MARELTAPVGWSRRWHWTPIDFHVGLSLLTGEVSRQRPLDEWLPVLADTLGSVVYGGRAGNRRDKATCLALARRFFSSNATFDLPPANSSWGEVLAWAASLSEVPDWELLCLPPLTTVLESRRRLHLARITHQVLGTEPEKTTLTSQVAPVVSEPSWERDDYPAGGHLHRFAASELTRGPTARSAAMKLFSGCPYPLHHASRPSAFLSALKRDFATRYGVPLVEVGLGLDERGVRVVGLFIEAARLDTSVTTLRPGDPFRSPVSLGILPCVPGAHSLPVYSTAARILRTANDVVSAEIGVIHIETQEPTKLLLHGAAFVIDDEE